MKTSNSDDGGPAFPTPAMPGRETALGMTLRDYFAAAALKGLLADPNVKSPPAPTASVAYEYADAMLAERAK